MTDTKPEVQTENKITDLTSLISIDELFANNWHFGYKTKYRSRSMGHYIFKSTNGIDILDLNKTAFLLNQACIALRKCVAKGGKVLFVGTETHSSNTIRLNAERCAQYYVSHRWLGGLLTNWNNTFSQSISIMKKLDKQIQQDEIGNFKKHERVKLMQKRDRFLKFLSGVQDMGNIPNMIVITSNREQNPIQEAAKLGIPCVLLADTTTDPKSVKYLVPGNDRSIKTVDMFVTMCADACLAGLKDEFATKDIKIDKQASPAKDNSQESHNPETHPTQENPQEEPTI